jgi:hypothetical protein
MAEKVAALEVARARIEERVDDLEEYRKKQNGTLQRLEEKIDRFTWWLVLTLGGVTTSLILLVINTKLGR